jgi:osmotically-inducible protein OsmY
VERRANSLTHSPEIQYALPAKNARHDAEIARTITRILHLTTDIPNDFVVVLVDGGRVTLRGVVDMEYQRLAANRAIRDVIGVITVSNHIAVKGDGEQVSLFPPSGFTGLAWN